MPAVCPACTGPAAAGRLLVGSYRLFICRKCGTQHLRRETPRARAREQPRYWEPYKLDLYADPEVQRSFDARYDRMIADARAHVGRIDTVLDVGCGIGNFLDYARRRGIRGVGSDLDPEAVAVARERGLEAVTSSDLDGTVPDGSMDAVTMWDVIEHLQEPVELLREVVRKVRPGGALLFETPDAAFPVRSAARAIHAVTGGRANLTGPLYYWEHKVYFTEQGLAALLERVGARPIVVRRETTVREKMAAQFRHDVQQGWRLHRVLARTWPALETLARRAGRGNKLMMIAKLR